MNAGEIKKLCAELRIAPSKSRGQNFLVNEAIMEKIISAAELTPHDTVLEVGPGFGALTEALLYTGAKVCAVEIEDKLAEYLENKFKNFILRGQLKILRSDILRTDEKIFQKFLGPDYKNRNYCVIANLPYQISGAAIQFFLERPQSPKKMILMLQKEVGQKLVAQPPDTGLSSIAAQYFSTPKIIAKVPAGNFWPHPAVDSCVVSFQNIRSVTAAESKAFFKFVKAGFKSPRKKLLTAFPKQAQEKILVALNTVLSTALNDAHSHKSQKNPKNKDFANVRPAELSIEDWKALFALAGRGIM